MLSKNKIKLIPSLNKKKTRDELKLFVAEGAKTIAELLNYNTEALFIAISKPQLEFTSKHGFELISTEQEFIDKASLLKTPQQAIAVFKQPKTNENYIPDPEKLVLALDDVQDPGNLGTMIRLANWFGIETIFFSPFASRITTTLFGSIWVLPVDLYSSGDVNLLPSSTLVSCECLGSSRLTALKAPHASRQTVIKKISASVSLRPSPDPVAETFGPAAGRLFTSSEEVLFSFWFIFFPYRWLASLVQVRFMFLTVVPDLVVRTFSPKPSL